MSTIVFARPGTVREMVPDCAICHRPAAADCPCEENGLQLAIKQAEDRVMGPLYREIHEWVRTQAQDYILEYFNLLTERRKNTHSEHLDQITAQAYHRYGAPPHPRTLAEAQAALKRGIDEDWAVSVQRYPEVLEYYFSLVTLSIPSDDDPAVQDPPLSALSGSRKAPRRTSGLAASASSPAMITSGQELEMQLDRRTPAPRNMRSPGYMLPGSFRYINNGPYS